MISFIHTDDYYQAAAKSVVYKINKIIEAKVSKLKTDCITKEEQDFILAKQQEATDEVHADADNYFAQGAKRREDQRCCSIM